MKPTIYIDYDSTLVDFITAWEKLILEKHNNADINLYDSSCEKTKNFVKENGLYDLIKNGDFYKHVPLFEGAFEFLSELNGHFEIKIVTSSMSSDQKKYKSIHIEKFFPGLVSEVIPARKKHDKTTNGVFMDDKFKLVKEHIENNNKMGILFNFDNRIDNSKYESEIKELKQKHPDKFSYVSNFEDALQLFLKHSKKKTTTPTSRNQNSSSGPKH